MKKIIVTFAIAATIIGLYFLVVGNNVFHFSFLIEDEEYTYSYSSLTGKYIQESADGDETAEIIVPAEVMEEIKNSFISNGISSIDMETLRSVSLDDDRDYADIEMKVFSGGLLHTYNYTSEIPSISFVLSNSKEDFWNDLIGDYSDETIDEFMRFSTFHNKIQRTIINLLFEYSESM